MTNPTFYGIHYSPWSQRARWALHLNHVEHDYKEYVILITMPALRLRLKKFGGRVTVPVLFDGDNIYDDSREIVRFADERGSANLDRRKDAEFESVLRDVEEIIETGRMITTMAVMKDTDAMLQSLPPFLPKNKLSLPIAYTACKYLEQKYGFDHDVEAGEKRMREAALRLQSKIAGREFFFDELTYADIAVATGMQMVQPIDRYIRLGAKALWTRDFANEVQELLSWRDAFFDAYHWRAKR